MPPAYLRDRLLLARELLHESGSCFVQISDENLHHVREAMDEVFGAKNLVSVISFRTKIPLNPIYIANTADYLVWYAKDRTVLKFRRLFSHVKSAAIRSSNFSNWRTGRIAK